MCEVYSKRVLITVSYTLYLLKLAYTLQGNNESIEPFTSNMYNRRVLAGEFAVINKYLLKDLTDMGLWTAEVTCYTAYYLTSITHLQVLALYDSTMCSRTV
jgi:Ribonucleotide reductase, barrel domain